MPTSKQLRGNRANAQQSAGPTSAEGKARSSGNALKSGIHAHSELLPWEDPAELDTLKTEYHDHYQPRTPDERRLVDSLVRGEFLSRRLHRAEVEIIVSKIPAGADPNDRQVIGKAWCVAAAELSRLQRRVTANDRAFHRNLKDLRLIQAERPEPVLSTTQSTETTGKTAQMASFCQIPEIIPPWCIDFPNPAANEFQSCSSEYRNGAT